MITQTTFAQFAAHLLTVGADIELAKEAAVVKACKHVAKTARNMLGHEQPFWPALKPETIEHKAHGNTPLLETGALRESIEWTAPVHEGGEVAGYVGSNHPEAMWQELGTKHIPPRSFIGSAARGQEHVIVKMIGRMVYGTMFHGGPHYREFMEAVHVWRHVWHQAKEIGREVADEHEGER